MRPDLTLIDRSERRGLLIDAKYRVDPSDRAPTSALSECQVYMHSFRQNTVVVCYPGSVPRLSEAVSGEFRILELSLAPHPELEKFVAEEERLCELMQPIGVTSA